MQLNQWTFLDYLFICILLVSTGFAIIKGLVHEIISLVALIGGFVLAVLYYHSFGRVLSEFARTDSVADFFAFLILFVGCLILGALISMIVNRFMKAVSIKWIDRVLGGLFGLLRGWAIASILVLALIAFPLRENIVPKSVLAPYLLAGARAAVLLVPQDMKDKFYEQYKKLLDKWNHKGDAA
jgi:membrane protein required for colicin V production